MLGKKLKDKITGFTGIATGKATYITGCDQYLLAPQCAENGSFIDGHWFDEGRLEIIDDSLKLEVAADKPGCDKEAPKK